MACYAYTVTLGGNPQRVIVSSLYAESMQEVHDILDHLYPEHVGCDIQ